MALPFRINSLPSKNTIIVGAENTWNCAAISGVSAMSAWYRLMEGNSFSSASISFGRRMWQTLHEGELRYNTTAISFWSVVFNSFRSFSVSSMQSPNSFSGIIQYEIGICPCSYCYVDMCWKYFSCLKRRRFGTRFLFRETLEIGFFLNDKAAVGFVYEHCSNAGLAGKRNQGNDNTGLRISYYF